MKTHLKILIPLTLLTIVALITACQKEDLTPKDTTATVRQSLPNEGSNPQVLTDRKPMKTFFYTEAIKILPVDNYQELLKLTANCNDRQKVARQYDIEYQNLTIATEIADLQRTGMTLIEAAMLQAATNPQDLQTQSDFIGVTDIIASKNQNIDVGLLAQMPPKPFFKVLLNFYKNQCSNCKDITAPSFDRIDRFIKMAKQLPVLVSYEKDGTCWSTSQANKDPQLSKTRNDPKPMITRTYTGAYEVLPIKNDDDLLQLAADCQDRKDLADRFNFPLEPFSIATEIADLKRTGISTDLATTIHAAAYIGILDVVGAKTDFIGIVDLIGGKHQTIDIGLLSMILPKPFYNVVIDFFDNYCTSCEESVRPTFEMIQSAIKKAKQLQIRVSYEKEDDCWSIERSSNNVKTEARRKPMMTRTYLHRKPMITRSYTEAFEILPIQSDQELLALTANCKDRQRIAEEYNIKLDALTIATEIADLKRTGISLDEASTIHTAHFIGIIDVIGGRIENAVDQTFDIGQLAITEPEQLHQFILNFVDNYCLDCSNTSVTSFDWNKLLINKAKQLPILVSYDKEGICYNGLAITNLSPFTPTFPSNNGSTPMLDSNRRPMNTSCYMESDRKPMRSSFYTEAIEILPVNTDEELLALTGDCMNRKAIALQYNMDYEQLTIATEIADLKRTGMCADQAALLQETYFKSHPTSIKYNTRHFRSQTPEQLHQAINNAAKNNDDYHPNLIPTKKQIQSWVQVAKNLPPLVTYEKQGICIP